MPRLSGRRAPAPLPEALKAAQRKTTSPVVVTTKPKGLPPEPAVEEMDSSVMLKRKDPPLPPRADKKTIRKKKKCLSFAYFQIVDY